jgi:hypothetical protein
VIQNVKAEGRVILSRAMRRGSVNDNGSKQYYLPVEKIVPDHWRRFYRAIIDDRISWWLKISLKHKCLLITGLRLLLVVAYDSIVSFSIAQIRENQQFLSNAIVMILF